MAALDAPRTVHVLIVDDNAWFREWESKFLGEQAGIYVVGTAASADEGIQMARELRPDLVLMDVAMRGMNGLEATLRIKAEAASPQVVIVTLHDLPQYRTAAAACADGFVPKTQLVWALMPLIDKLFPGTGAFQVRT